MASGKIPSKLQNALICLILVSGAVWSIWPVLTNFGSGLVGYGDVLLQTWILNQNIQKIPGNLGELFQGNIFYPFKDSMAFSELLFPSSVIAYAAEKITELPVTAFNFSLIAGQIFLILIPYFWFKELTGDKYTSFVAASAFALSQIRFFFQGYLQMWNMEWLLLALFMLWKYKNQARKIYLLGSAVFIGVQAWESLLPILFFIFSATVLFLTDISFYVKKIKDFLCPAIIFVILSLPVFYKYLQVSTVYGITRSIRESAHFSMSLDDLWGILFSPGLFSLLLISLFFLNKKMLRKEKDLLWFIGIAIAGLVMALGPVLKFGGLTVKLFSDIFIPLPYGVFYYLIPVFKGFRTPLRWIWLFGFAITAIFALVLSKSKFKYKNALLTICLFLSVFGGTKIREILPVAGPNNFPGVYKFVKTLPERVMIEIPMYSWGIGEPFQHEFWRMYYSLDHRKLLVNGASGFNPPAWEILQNELWIRFPDRDSEDTLRKIGVNYILVHKDELGIDQNIKISQWDRDKIIWSDSNNVIYLLK